MEEWCAFLEKTYRPAHLSMHFDGVRVSLPDEVDAAKVCRQSEEYIEEQTGIKLCIQVKHHHYFLQLLAALGTQSSVDDVDDILLKDGNCIPAAIASMYPEQLDSMKKLVAGSDVTTRTYRECLSCTNLVAFPSAMLDNALKWARLDPGRYLLHLENGHEPHCIAVVAEDKGEVYINDGGSCWQMKNEDIVELLQGAIDYKTMVIFELKNSESDEVVEVSRDRLLSLRAGGIKRKPVGLPSSSGMECDDAAEDPALPAHDLMRCLTLSFISLFFWKKAGKTTKKTRIFCPYRTPKIPGKEGENAQKNKEFLARRKNKEFQKNKERKDRVPPKWITMSPMGVRLQRTKAMRGSLNLDVDYVHFEDLPRGFGWSSTWTSTTFGRATHTAIAPR